MGLAPIVVFAYNRAEHLKKSIEALAKNPEAKESIVYFFSDGPKQNKIENVESNDEEKRKTNLTIEAKNRENREKVEAVRQYIDSIKEKNYFKQVIINKSPVNKGLANNVISGVDEVVKKHGKVIVLEDDAVCSNQFLGFMNGALDFYEKYNKKIWYIGGYIPQLNIPEDYKHTVYLMGRGSSFAWATWLDRWEKVDWDVSDYNKFKINLLDRYRFDEFGDDRSQMLDCQMIGKVDSWAIRFSYAMFKNNMYAILPTKTLIKTIGRDGSGTHAKSVSHDFDVDLSKEHIVFSFEDVDLDKRIVSQHLKYFYRNKLFLLKEYIKNVILKK